ncbi:MAG: SDR family NAD(P)-dependent oxidoreductase [Methanosarcina sp.]|uniref:SDR family NAD(P)-dependent oxidoreductase n=1 Tax=Methanosarcina sp. TaxID=2213 RepID=UPI0026298C46|nr:SDR family NAD(P)-dependent oxidoreductase [Methanosarcina sp.]MDD3247420.1 SDR family NAD(P)-dependent oxidoreductase [Methanosarcina sp.]
MNLLGFIFSSSSLFISVYCASKFANIGLTEALAYEVGGGLQVYAVCPAGVDTRLAVPHHILRGDEPQTERYCKGPSVFRKLFSLQALQLRSTAHL